MGPLQFRVLPCEMHWKLRAQRDAARASGNMHTQEHTHTTRWEYYVCICHGGMSTEGAEEAGGRVE